MILLHCPMWHNTLSTLSWHCFHTSDTGLKRQRERERERERERARERVGEWERLMSDDDKIGDAKCKAL